MGVTKKRQVPGVLTGIIACIPLLNWFALIIIGFRCASKFNILCGALYGWFTYKFIDIGPFLWVITLFQYWIAYTCALCRDDREVIADDYEEFDEELIDIEFSEIEIAEEVRQLPDKKAVEDKVELNFSEIERLRAQSAEVRSMLEVSQVQLFVDRLSMVHRRVLKAILSEEYVWEKIGIIAREQRTMPDLLLDEINEIANRYLEDIVIDTFAAEISILEEYKEEIRKRIG